MNTSLEDFIKENRTSFDTLEAPEANWEKIRKSRKNSITKYKLTLVLWRSVAATAVILIGLTIYFSMPNTALQSMSTAFDSELEETMSFYNNQIAIKKQAVYQLTSSHPEMRKELDKDLQELDEVLIELQKDLSDNIDNTEVVEAMIQNYRIKISILEDIQNYLDKKNTTTKNNTYEL